MQQIALERRSTQIYKSIQDKLIAGQPLNSEERYIIQQAIDDSENNISAQTDQPSAIGYDYQREVIEEYLSNLTANIVSPDSQRSQNESVGMLLELARKPQNAHYLSIIIEGLKSSLPNLTERNISLVEQFLAIH